MYLKGPSACTTAQIESIAVSQASKCTSPTCTPQQTPSPPQTPASGRRARVRVNFLNGQRESAPETAASSRHGTPDQASPAPEPLQAQEIVPEVPVLPGAQSASVSVSGSASVLPTIAEEHAVAAEQQVSACSLLQASAPQQSGSGPTAAFPLSLHQSLFPAEPGGDTREAALNEQPSQRSEATVDVPGLSNAAEAPQGTPSPGGPDTSADPVPANAPPTGAAAGVSAACAESAGVSNADPIATPVGGAEAAASMPCEAAAHSAPQAASMPAGASTLPEPDLAPATAPDAAPMDAEGAEGDDRREGASLKGTQASPAEESEDRALPGSSADAVSISGTDEDEDNVCGPNDLVVGHRNGKPIILRDVRC